MTNGDLSRSPTPEAAKSMPRPKKRSTPHSDTPLAKSKVTSKRGSKDLGDADSFAQPPNSNRPGTQDKNFGMFSGIDKRFMDSVRNKPTSKISSIAEEDTDAPIGSLLPKITTSSNTAEDSGVAPGVRMARSMSKALYDGIDFEAMLQANQAIMIKTPAPEETKADHKTHTKAMKPQLTKRVSKDAKRKNDESSKSDKSQASKLAVTTFEEAVPHVTSIPSSDEDLSEVPKDIDKKTEIEQRPKQRTKTKAVISTVETVDLGKKRTSAVGNSLLVPEMERLEPPRKNSRVPTAASCVAGKVQHKPATERPGWFPKRPKTGYILKFNESTHAAMKMFEKILELTKRPSEWDRANILKDDDYDYSNEHARQRAEEYGHESAVDVFHYLFHKRDDEESLEYRKGRRDYAQIELQFTGAIDPSMSLDDPEDDVYYERGSIKAHVTCNPYFRDVRVWDEWQNMSRDAYDVKKQVCLDIILYAPHVLRTGSWALLLVMTILSKDGLCGALKRAGIRVSEDWYDDCLADMLKRFCRMHSDYGFLEVAKCFGLLSEIIQREPPNDDDEYSGISSADEDFDYGPEDSRDGRPVPGSKKGKAPVKQGTKRGSDEEGDGPPNKQRKG